MSHSSTSGSQSQVRRRACLSVDLKMLGLIMVMVRYGILRNCRYSERSFEAKKPVESSHFVDSEGRLG